MLNNASDKTVKFLYEDYYTNREYDSLWYRGRDGLALDKNAEGKPWVICGDVTYLDESIKSAFYIKRTQWPNEASSADPAWISLIRTTVSLDELGTRPERCAQAVQP